MNDSEEPRKIIIEKSKQFMENKKSNERNELGKYQSYFILCTLSHTNI